MTYTRPFPAAGLATTMFVGSTAGGALIVATNLARSDLRIQPLTSPLRISPIGSVNGSAMVIGTQAILTVPGGLTGPLFASPDPGATAPVAIWESSQ